MMAAESVTVTELSSRDENGHNCGLNIPEKGNSEKVTSDEVHTINHPI